jgi:hypothetical protein
VKAKLMAGAIALAAVAGAIYIVAPGVQDNRVVIGAGEDETPLPRATETGKNTERLEAMLHDGEQEMDMLLARLKSLEEAVDRMSAVVGALQSAERGEDTGYPLTAEERRERFEVFRDEMRALSEAQTNRFSDRIASVKAEFLAEARDPRFAQDRENGIMQALQDATLPGAYVDNVECRSNTCEVAYTLEEGPDSSIVELDLIHAITTRLDGTHFKIHQETVSPNSNTLYLQPLE